MANQPYELNPAASEKAASNRHPTIANLPAVTAPSALSTRPVTNTHQCPNCGAWAPASTSVCSECGTRLQQKPQKIRCRVCSSTVSASLVLCPSCGRELHAAPSRILSWGAPTVIVFLFLVVMVQRWESGNPLRWIQSQFVNTRDWVAQAAQQLDPQITISTQSATGVESGVDGLSAVPLADSQVNPLVLNPSTTTLAEQTVLTQTNSTGQESIGQANAAITVTNPGVAVASVITATATVEPVPATATALPTAPPTPTATAPAPTATAAPTLPPTPTVVPATPTVALRQPTNEAIVQAAPGTGSTDEGVVAAAKVTTAQTTAVTILQATATAIPSATAVPTQTPVPTAPAVTYTVRAGDTPLGIASRFDIGVDELLAANGMSIDDARLLRVGQVLVVSTSVPVAPTPVPSATPMPTQTAPAVATNTPLPTATAVATTAAQAGMRVDAPVLRSPEAGSFLSCGSVNSLTWLPVAYVRDSDQYLLHLGFLSGYNGDGSEQVTWILEQARPANTTLWDLDQSLCGLAPQAYGRQWRWYVQVVEAEGTSWRPISSPSSIWGFNWN